MQSRAVQEPVARHHPAALDRADGPVGAGVLVDLRSAVLDHLLSVRRRAGHPFDSVRFPQHDLAREVVADRGQYLARYPVRGDLTSGRAADHLALALRGGAA